MKRPLHAPVAGDVLLEVKIMGLASVPTAVSVVFAEYPKSIRPPALNDKIVPGSIVKLVSIVVVPSKM